MKRKIFFLKFNINNFENFFNIWIYNTTLKFIKIQLKYKR